MIEERHGYWFDDLAVGMSEVYERTITEIDIERFAEVSGDTNPMHLDHEFASQTCFESRIAHGMLTASLISTVIGTKLPGPGCIYLGQDLKFVAPVRIGDTVTVRATVRELFPDRNHVSLKTVCTVGDTTVLHGKASVYVPPK